MSLHFQVSLRHIALVGLAFATSSCFSSNTNECGSRTGVVCPPGSVCTYDDTSCRASDSLCGDGHDDPGEACDDGNVLPGDGCSANCRSTEICGNGVVDVAMPLNRDDDPTICLTSTTPDTGCAEECDWGPAPYVPGNGCSPNCLSDEKCGNLIVDSHLPNRADPPIPPHLCLDGSGIDCAEVCDDGNQTAGDECSANCLSLERCGNGITDPGETCDDGDGDDSVGCRNNCMSSASCGDGVVGPGEECDDTSESVRCDGPGADPETERCTARVCGDGYVNGAIGETPDHMPILAEECDPDAIGVDSAGCDRDCTLPHCGDGITNEPHGEQCDDRGVVDGDGCSGMCQLEPYSLGVERRGEGSVMSAVPGIDCGPDCFQPYPLGATVTLTATPAAQWTFDTSIGLSSGWAGCDTITLTGQCQVTMMAARAVTATFEPNLLTVVRAGDGTGEVRATGIDCGTDCEQAYDVGTLVRLTAEPTAATSELVQWSEPTCPNTSLTCAVTMDRKWSVTATFRLKTFALTVTFPASGDGKVTLSHGGDQVECDTGPDCTTSYLAGDEVTLFAEAEANSDFTGWSGVNCPGTGHCTIVMTAAQSVAASFPLKTFSLTAAKTGLGTGTVSTLTQPVIDCGSDCWIYAIGTVVRLRAEAVAGSRFVRWTDDCSGTADLCEVTMVVNRSVTAEFRPVFPLHVSKVGNGAVSSIPDGIDCGATCDFTYDSGTPVQLSAIADVGWRFASWSGCATTSGSICDVTMSAARNVTATFIRVHDLTVTKSGSGSGTVTSLDGEINCGSGAGCTATYDVATTVQLNAAPLSGSRFIGWSGCTTSSGSTCNVTMSAAQAVTATFALEFTLSVVRNGNGTVTSDAGHPGISCGSDCGEPYVDGATVALTAAPAGGSRFVGWTGPCVIGADPLVCTVTMTAARTVTAEFRTTYVLGVSKTGSGTVEADVGGLLCGAACSATYDIGTEVELAATADAGWRFSGWSGVSGCAGLDPCIVTMSQARSVTATFVRVHLLTVTKTGQGTVTASPAGNPPGITATNCDPNITTCFATFDQGTSIVLTATPAAGSRVVGWTGACTSTTTTTCTVNNIAAITTVSVAFVAAYTVTVTRNGTGAGTVTSTPGINCGSDCNEIYDGGTSVVLTAAPSFEDAFTGWSGDGGCAPDLVPPYTCTVLVNANMNIVATFDDNTLSVETTGAGSGTVTSSVHSNTNPINCSGNSGNCDESYVQGTQVTLAATAPTGSRFVSWAGCTPQVGDPTRCDIVMNGPATATALFRRTEALTLTKSSAAGGDVTATQTDQPPPPPDLSCGTSCISTSVRFDRDATVVLTATPAPGFIMGAWTGCASFTFSTCTVTMASSRAVGVTFTPLHLLTVDLTGSGTVGSFPGGITCPGDCTEDFSEGTSVTLVAGPDTGQVVTWGNCTLVPGLPNNCTVTMDAAKTVTAVFSPL